MGFVVVDGWEWGAVLEGVNTIGSSRGQGPSIRELV